MMRGAQSGGVVTYVPDKTATGPRGLRVRVVNGKRTNLDELARTPQHVAVFCISLVYWVGGKSVVPHSRSR